MIKIKQCMLLIVCSVLGSHQIFSMEQPERQPQHIIRLPIACFIDPTSKDRLEISFKVTIPSGFYPIHGIDTISQFIPTSEFSADEASQLVLTEVIRNKQYHARDYIDALKSIFLHDVHNKARVDNIGNQRLDHYDRAYLLLSYVQDNYPRLLFATYYSGPSDCSGIRYDIALKNGVSREDALSKLAQFVQNMQIDKIQVITEKTK